MANDPISQLNMQMRFNNNVLNTILADMATSANPPAGVIPAADLQTTDDIKNEANIAISSNQKITADLAYKALVAVMSKMTNVRKYHINTYYNNNGNQSITGTAEGKAAFKDALTGDSSSLKSSPKNGNQGFDGVSNPFSVGQVVKESTENDFFSQLVKKWQEYYNNAVTYNHYTCHSSCHSSCHGSGRGRR